eukprot:TRINITY_DN67346_c0_g1_i1.p1 TRINITY_DN67346_c0_g1~~TRINITY_DN67346_c0_g1_i1.p1  ORF type:complete len:682 (-),score=106.83 TRINITY_DN67346_c0_g1_i1:35-2080(-)
MDNYVLVERLGHGSFAVVWKARRKSDNRLVAVKQFKQSPATWEECKRLPEIRAAAAVRGCPHIIAMLEVVRHGSELFLVLEYADSDLCRCLGPSRRFEEPQVRWAMRQVLSALAAVHAAGIVHCDVKPENLLLFSKSGPGNLPVLKLCDLGQAAQSGDVQSYVGTRWYRAPELLLGFNRGGEEVDLWAAGCAMAELVLLRPPFPGTDTRDMLFRMCSALGAPEDDWPLNEQLMEASGLRFAPCAAEGPVWFELSSAGASPPAVDLVRQLLQYAKERRLPAARALNLPFFAASALEVPILPPETDRARVQSVERLQRNRDEAKAVERKLGVSRSGASFGSPGILGGFGGSPGFFQGGGSCGSGERTPSNSGLGSVGGGGPSLPNRRTAPAQDRQAVRPPLQSRGVAHTSSDVTGYAQSRGNLQRSLPSSSFSNGVHGSGGGGGGGGCCGAGSGGHSTNPPSPLPRRSRRQHAEADGDSDGEDDEELAALFWSQVSRGPRLSGGVATDSRQRRPWTPPGFEVIEGGATGYGGFATGGSNCALMRPPGGDSVGSSGGRSHVASPSTAAAVPGGPGMDIPLGGVDALGAGQRHRRRPRRSDLLAWEADSATAVEERRPYSVRSATSAMAVAAGSGIRQGTRSTAESGDVAGDFEEYTLDAVSAQPTGGDAIGASTSWEKYRAEMH